MQATQHLLRIGNEGFSLMALSQWDYLPKNGDSESAMKVWLIGREQPRIYRGIQADLLHSYLKFSCNCIPLEA